MDLLRLRIMKRHFENSVRYGGYALCYSVFLCCLASSPALSQDADLGGLSLEDYMENDEPAQSDLQKVDSGTASSGSATSRLQEAMMADSGAQDIEESRDDALPQIDRTFEMGVSDFGLDDASSRGRDIKINIEDVANKTEEEIAEEIRREAFDAAITGLFPMRPDQIRMLLREYDATKRAVKEPVFGVPTPQVNVATVSLDPGVAPMIITTATGHVTTLNILDVTGAPWPIKDISWAGDFEVIEPEEGGHIVRITPLEQAAYGNMSIQLLTLKTPVTIMLKTSKDEVQYRVDARIPEYGPFAQASIIQGGTERVAGNGLIMSVLDGVPPNGAVRLSVSGVDGRTSAYNVNGMTYLRTPLALLSPGWEQSVSSADGMNVYALGQAPVVLLSDQGRFVRASLNEAKGLLE